MDSMPDEKHWCMASPPAFIEPAVLKWARESMNLDFVAAERKIAVPPGRVAEWEAGQVRPTIPQLRRAAVVYRRPLAVFFLPQPPRDFDAMRDFRRHEGAGGGDWSPELHAEYRRAITQRDNALELAELDESRPPTDWRLDASGNDARLAALGRQRLVEVSPLRLPTAAGGKYDHINFWTAALEEAGVLVLATSRGSVAVQEMRAFSLYYEESPVIVVNGADSVRGRLFSLLHEYAHLVLHTGGLCDTVTDLAATTPDRRLEARCNAIAADILMPRGSVLDQRLVGMLAGQPTAWTYELLLEAAAPFGVSAEAFLRRLLTLGLVSRDFYQDRREEFLAAYDEEEGRAKSGGGNWYYNTARDRGKGYIRRVADAHRRRVIDSYTAASFLDVKVEQIGKLADAASLGAPA